MVFLAFWLGLAVGILVKGPMVPLFVALPALFLSWKARSARWLLPLRPWAGLALTALIVAPWFVAITVKSGGAFYAEAVGKDMLGKVGGAAERHWGPPGTYTIAFFATFWPGAAFAAMSLPLAWRKRRTDAIAFLIATILPAWIMFEAVPTKLPHYVLPLMPWIAVLTILAPEFADGQQGTLHFSYLLKDHGGFVEVAPDVDTHRRQLAAAVKGDFDARAIRTFIETFLRPHGIDRPATPFMVRAIEEFAHTTPRAPRPGVTSVPAVSE